MKFLACFQRDVGRQCRRIGIGNRFKNDRAIAGESPSPRIGQLLGFIDPDSAKADRIGESCIGEIRQFLAGHEANVAHHYPLLPSHLIEIAVVEHQRYPSRVQPFLPIFGHGDACIESVHLHRPIASYGDADAIGEAEFRADGVGNRRAHGGEISTAAGHHALADFQIARIPVRGGAAVGREDATIRKVPAQLPENALGIQAPIVALGMSAALDCLPPVFNVLDDCLLPAAIGLALEERYSASNVCWASPFRFTSIGYRKLRRRPSMSIWTALGIADFGIKFAVGETAADHQ